MATAAATLVAIADSAAIVLRYGGGRAREVGYAWLLHLVSLKLELDPFPHSPAILVRYQECTDWQQFLVFLAPAILFNVVLAWFAAAVVIPLAPAGSVFSWRPRWRIALWLFSLSPFVLHLFCESTIIGLGLQTYTGRLLRGVLVLAVVWGGLSLLRYFGSRMAGASRILTAAGLFLFVGVTSSAVIIAPFLSTGVHPEAAGGRERPNILLISIDSLRADHLHSYGYPRETSPNLDALASQGARFRYAVSPTSWTLPAHMTLLTSLAPHQHGVNRDLTRLSPSALTLAEVLHHTGYETAAFVSAPYLRAEYGFPQGFDLYNDYTAISLVRNAQSQVTSPTLVKLVRRWIDRWSLRQDHRPFFVFLHMWDVHFDYIPPPPYNRMFDPGYTGTITGENFEFSPIFNPRMDPRDLQHVIALYDGEIRYTDHHLGELFAYLRNKGLFDDTIVAVTADHGDEFFEHGKRAHRNSLYDEVLLVPLIVRYPPATPAGRVIDPPVRLQDVGPTLLSLAGVTPPAGFGMSASQGANRGLDLSPLFSDTTAGKFPALTAFGDLEGRLGSVRTREQKLIISLKGDPAPELYDLLQDPGEHHNLATDDPATVERLYQQVKAFRRPGASDLPARPLRVEPEHLKVLKSLGYLR